MPATGPTVASWPPSAAAAKEPRSPSASVLLSRRSVRRSGLAVTPERRSRQSRHREEDRVAVNEQEVHDEVRSRYAEAAIAAAAGHAEADALEACCAPDGSIAFGNLLYSANDRAALPDAAVLASLGCGNPTAVAELREGER